jgi:RNA polymerase sigma-70 factor, ECF subfamily
VSKLPSTREARGKLSDEQLLKWAREASPTEAREAASTLLDRYRERVYRWCYGRVGNQEEALDLAQDVLLSAYRGLESFDGRARFSSWLFSIARNRCLNALRRPQLFEEGLEMERFPNRQVGQDELLTERQDEDRLLAIIREHLPPLDRQVLWLRCFEKMPVDNITRLLDIEESSGARAVLQRARRRLRAAMSAEEGDEAHD